MATNQRSRSSLFLDNAGVPGRQPGWIELDDDNLKSKAQHYEGGDASHLPPSHREYLLQRHGTLDLDPMPSADPADPYNWPQWKKNANLTLVAFHACMTTFIAAGIIPAYEEIAEDLKTTVPGASYLTSMQIGVLGFAPLFWKPISYRYGRRPMWLISTICAGAFNIGCALSKTYGAMAACRCLVSFFISPAIAIGSGVVVETFFKRERGLKMGLWALMVTLGPPGGPFFMGFVAKHIGYRYIYWIFAIINAVQFILYLFFGPETRYVRSTSNTMSSNNNLTPFKAEYTSFRRIDPTPLKPVEFVAPLALAKHATIIIPTIAYTLVFGFCSVFLTVEIPQIFIPKFGLDPQQIGLQFLGIIIGSIIGEQLGGPLSDVLINRRTKALHGLRPAPEYRLWLSYLGFLLSVVGLIVFGITTQNAQKMHYTVVPIVGIGIAACGNQIVTTVLVTYAVDSNPTNSTSIGVFVNVIRSTWGFIGPFWFPDMIEGIQAAGSGGLMAGVIVLGSVLPILALQLIMRNRR